MNQKTDDKKAEALAIATIAGALIGEGSRTDEDVKYAIEAARKLIAAARLAIT